MTDIVDRKTRSRMMSGIRGHNTKPELLVRSLLHRQGFRFRLHAKDLPGKPDIVFPRYNAVIFVNGCFWHGHDCHLFKWPSTREEFWRQKINRNRHKDHESIDALHSGGWRIGIVWECALKGKYRLSHVELMGQISEWLYSTSTNQEIRGVEYDK
ncbi:MAG: DNA mismatch endonuclease Vsr [Chlorobiaceae bacterium]|jgi:DNA mismatch endonuclease (patch repair protein)|nr:DNA mismatch endonuclease Vsr [Chlorobiaceae bacterium]NTW09791.1 DNA mismatch endonuclease Vsr [Chlorobiaceae bacterium]